MLVKVISLENCNAAASTIKLIRKKAAELGLDIDPKLVVVKTTEEAIEHRHIGGPTVQINGLDIEKDVRELEQFAIS